MLVMIVVIMFHKTVFILFSSGKKNMLTDELYNCVQSISIFEQKLIDPIVQEIFFF